MIGRAYTLIAPVLGFLALTLIFGLALTPLVAGVLFNLKAAIH